MHYFQQQLLDYTKNNQFHFLLNQPIIRPVNYLCPVENSHYSVQEIINEYTVKMPVHPELTAKQQDLSFYIHTQEKKQAIIFEIEEVKRKPLKKKIIKKILNPVMKDGIKQCLCCQAKFLSKHKCEHTICQKPCAKLRKSDKIRRAKKAHNKQHGPSHQSKEQSFIKDSQYYNQDDDQSDPQEEYRIESQSLQSLSDIDAKKTYIKNKEKRKKIRGKRRRRRENRDESKISKSQPKDSEHKIVEMRDKQNESHQHNQISKIEKQISIQQKVVQGVVKEEVNNQTIREQDAPNNSSKNMKNNQKQKNPEKGRRRRGKKSSKSVINDHVSSNQLESEFFPAPQIVKKKISRNRGRRSTDKSQIKSRQFELSMSSKKGRKSASYVDGSSIQSSSISYGSTARLKKSLSYYCQIEALAHNQIFQLRFDKILQQNNHITKTFKMDEEQNICNDKEKPQLSLIEQEGANNQNSYISDNQKTMKQEPIIEQNVYKDEPQIASKQIQNQEAKNPINGVQTRNNNNQPSSNLVSQKIQDNINETIKQ